MGGHPAAIGPVRGRLGVSLDAPVGLLGGPTPYCGEAGQTDGEQRERHRLRHGLGRTNRRPAAGDWAVARRHIAVRRIEPEETTCLLVGTAQHEASVVALVVEPARRDVGWPAAGSMDTEFSLPGPTPRNP